MLRRLRDVRSVATINVFLGWTIVGWGFALAMSVRSTPTPTMAASSSSEPLPDETPPVTQVDWLVAPAAEPAAYVAPAAESGWLVAPAAEPDLLVVPAAEPDLMLVPVAEPDLLLVPAADPEWAGASIDSALPTMPEMPPLAGSMASLRERPAVVVTEPPRPDLD